MARSLRGVDGGDEDFAQGAVKRLRESTGGFNWGQSRRVFCLSRRTQGF